MDYGGSYENYNKKVLMSNSAFCSMYFLNDLTNPTTIPKMVFDNQCNTFSEDNPVSCVLCEFTTLKHSELNQHILIVHVAGKITQKR